MTRVIMGMVFACLLAGTASARGEEGANWLVPLGSAVSHTANLRTGLPWRILLGLMSASTKALGTVR